MRIRQLILHFAVYSVMAAQAQADPVRLQTVLYVSPKGNDGWSGKLAAPNRGRSDGPFATIERAQTAARTALKGGSERIAVEIRGGTYLLDAALAFTAEDSGTAGHPVVYEAFRGEHPVLSGGAAIEGWKMAKDGSWQAVLPEALAAKVLWGPGSLYVNGQRRERPRLPKAGYYYVAKTEPPSPDAGGKGFDRIGYKPGDIDPKWADVGDVEILPFHIWTMSRFRIRSIDDAGHTLTWMGVTPGTAEYFDTPRGHRYLIENVKGALTEAGEYYFDRSTRTLTYRPLPGETLRTAEFVAPRLERLATFNHTHDIMLRGLTFAHSGWQTPPAGHSDPQADVDIGGAITFKDSTSCSLDRCRIVHTGGWAVDVGDRCSGIVLRGCDLMDLGAGGVKVGGEQTTHDVTVEGTNIAHGGRVHPAAVGVWIGLSSHNLIKGNTISDFYYTGISVGWTWGYAATEANHNILSGNRIQHIGQGVLSDMGGIYTLGVSPGTVLEHNWIEDVRSYDYGGWGIYFDEGSTDILAADNVVFGVKNACFHQHYGKENRVVNNIFAYGDKAQIQRTRVEDHLSFYFDRNIVLFDQGQVFTGNWSGSLYELSDNLYWNSATRATTLDGQTLADRQAAGQDKGSLIADPLFVDPKHGDFRLRQGSPALKIGFKPIEMGGFGSGRPLGPSVPPAFPVGFSSG